MIRSMTGFASTSRDEAGHKVTVTAKSVNHRFLDLALKAPQSLASLESRLRALVQQRLARGRLELAVTLEVSADLGRDVVVNEHLVDRVGQAMEALRARGLIAGGLTASDVLRIPQAVEIRHTDASAGGPSAAAGALIEAAVIEALDALVAMRATEGGLLRTDLDARLAPRISLWTDRDRRWMHSCRNLWQVQSRGAGVQVLI